MDDFALDLVLFLDGIGNCICYPSLPFWLLQLDPLERKWNELVMLPRLFWADPLPFPIYFVYYYFLPSFLLILPPPPFSLSHSVRVRI